MKAYIVLSRNKDNEDLPNRHIFELDLPLAEPPQISLSLDGCSWCGQVSASLELIRDQGPTIYAISHNKPMGSQWERSQIKSLDGLDDLKQILAKASGNLCEDCMELFADD